jgi:RimJ/RimL family protein N-acetyltransferase
MIVREVEAVRLQLKQFIARNIETPRLQLRQFTADDAEELYYIYSHPGLFKYMSNEKPLLLEQTRAAIQLMTENWEKYNFGVWAIIHKEDQRLIGHCGLKFLENTTEVQVGYLLLQSYWGQGLGTEAAWAALKYGFEVIRLPRIVAIAKPENIASRRVMEKMGMEYEKDAYFYENDVVYYSMLRTAYLSRVRGLKPTSDPQHLPCHGSQPLCLG